MQALCCAMASSGGEDSKASGVPFRSGGGTGPRDTIGAATAFWAMPPVRLGLSGRNSGEIPETLSERFLEFPLRVRLGSPKPYTSRHLRLPEHFQNSLPLITAGDASFVQKWFRRGPFRAGHGIPSTTEGISDFSFCLREKNQRGFVGPPSIQSGGETAHQGTGCVRRWVFLWKPPCARLSCKG